MISKKFLIYSLCILALTGCNDKQQSNKNTNNDKTKIVKTKTLDMTADYSPDVTGKWTWIAKKNDQMIGMGGFIFHENTEKKKLNGEIRVLVSGVELSPEIAKKDPKTPQPAGMVIINKFEGERLDPYKIKFAITDQQGNTTVNTGTIMQKGGLMSGKSVVEFKRNDKKIPFEYEWSAVRMSGNDID